MKELDQNLFENEVLNSPGKVVIDFWAEWCPSCVALMPTIENIASKYGRDIKFYKCNVDANGDIASQLRVMGIPTVMVLENGIEINRLINAHPEQDYINMING